MNEKFFELKKEKQDRMINAALLVFSKYGYYHASTDEIVKEANISKGLLFHYFGSKIGMYAFLYDYATRFVTLELTANVEKNETDYFALYNEILSAMAASMAQYPYIFLFLKKANDETQPEASQGKSIEKGASRDVSAKTERRRDSVLAALRQKQAQTGVNRQDMAQQRGKANRKERGTAI